MEVLAKPFGQEDRTGPEMWIDEAIWGHRLHDEQSPWLTLLEFLCVLHAEDGQARALTEARLNELSYRPQTQLRLRNLLFNNPHMATVLVVRSIGRGDVVDLASIDDRKCRRLGSARFHLSAGSLRNVPGFCFRGFVPAELRDRRGQQQAVEFEVRFSIRNERAL